MAYDAYGGERQYGGPAPPRARGGRGGPPPQAHYGAPQQQYDGYHDGYGYDQNYDNNAGHQQGYDDPYQQADYGRGQPPPQPHQDYYEPPPSGRGGRPGPGPDPRGGGHYPPQGRGGMRPPGQGPGPGRGMGRRPHPGGRPDHGGRPPPRSEPPISPRAQGSGGDPYARRGDMDQMADQMSNMHMKGHGGRDHPGARASAESQRAQGDYGRPPMDGPPRGQQQGYFDPRSGLPQGQSQGGYSGYDDGYGGRPPPQRPGHEFAPPGRSMTMPNNPTAGREMAPQQGMPYEDPRMQRRPSSADHRPAPQQAYPAQQQHQQDYGYDQYGGGHDYGQGYGQPQAQPQRGSYDNGYDQYYDQGRGGYQDPSQTAPSHQKMQSQSSLPDFDMITTNNRGSFEQTMRPGAETPQPGAHQKAQLNHAKSQPDLRQPQTAIFEMAGDIPSVPPMPPVNQPPSRQGTRDNYGGGGPAAYERMPARNPSAPPGPMGVPKPTPMGPSSIRSEPPPKNPDALPSHPTPVRAGLMSNSVVNLNDKPPPVRNYGGIPQAPTPQPQRIPQQQPQQPPPQTRAVQQKPPEPPVTPQELEHLRMVIKNNPKDEESALRLAKRLIEAADVLLPNVPDPKVRGRARERYVMDAHKILKKLANAQNIGAMFTMADSLGRGLFGGDSDSKEAFTLYQSAAKLGHAGAAYRTAVCCEIGQEEGGGTRKDPLKAIQWYKRAASLGDTPAMYKVGMILLKGLLGQPRNPREAVGWLKRAAERADPDNPHALHELGLLYESAKPNDTIIRDEPYAMSLFQQAAELGYKFSQFRLGQAYEYGSNGCFVDPRMSIMWYSKAAQKEEHQAELALSGWYLTGSDGVLKQSDQEAYLWARKAAVAGLAKAEYAMGYFTEVGIGVPANLEDAKRWYWRAAAQDFPKARERLEDLKRGRNAGGAGRPERISRSKIEKQQEGECVVM